MERLDHPENAPAYEALLNGEIAPNIVARAIPGLRELAVLRRVEAPGHFLTLMTFDNWSAVEQFAGPDPTASVVPSQKPAPSQRLVHWIRPVQTMR